MRRRLLVFVCGALAAAPVAARPAPPGPVATVAEAPIERVVVYSDQARVYRAARVTLGAEAAPVTLAALPPGAWPDTVRVECESAEIANVEVSRTWARLPRQAEGKALLVKIEQVLDEVRALEDEQRLLQTELGIVESLQPLPERKRPDKEPPLMFVETWRRVIQWTESRGARARARLAAMPARRYALDQRLQALRVEGRKLLPDAASGPALRVVVTLRGKPGPHDVSLSYVVGGVRWVPSYDLRYDPQNPAVEATYYAVVSQASGEDWKQARFAFSTILPSNLLAVPELPTWTLGKTTGFTPTPRERWEQRPVPWRAPSAAPEPDPALVELEQAVGRLPAGADEQEERTKATVDTTLLFPTESHLQSLTQAARNQRDVIKLNCVNDKLTQVQALRRMAAATEQELRGAQDAASRNHAQARLRVIIDRVRALRQEAGACVGEQAAYDGRLRELEKNVDKAKQEIYRSRARAQLLRDTVLGGRVDTPAAQAPPPPPAEPKTAADEDRDGVADEEVAAKKSDVQPSRMTVLQAAPAARRSRGRSFGRLLGFSAGSSRSSGPPRETVPWTDTGYRPPYLDPDLPAASAKGHRFTMEAPGRHSVVANEVPVRVPLLRERFAVTPVYKIVPGRSKAAYLTAEIFNSSGRPVLRGHANLFTGATYSGQTKLETAVPGAKLLLPLGVDEGVKVNRMINQKTVQTGVVFKDDVSEYTVTIEIANHRRHPIRVEVEDQLPVTLNKDTKVDGFEASPAMTGPALDGKIGWQGSVGAGSVQKLTIKFRIIRPKNWEIRQNDG
jgi:hypothetical protein